MIIKIILVGLCVCVLCVVLKQYSSSFVVLAEVCFAAIVAVVIFNKASEAFNRFYEIYSLNSVSDKLFKCLIKGALVCIITKIACDISSDSGNKTVSDIIELSGRVVLLALAMPFIESIIKTAVSFAL